MAANTSNESNGMTADRVYLNATIRTMAGSTEPAPTALWCRDGRFGAVGSAAEVWEQAGARAEVVDLAGATVVPGFIETHLHPLIWGVQLSYVDAHAQQCPTIDTLIEALTARAASTPRDEPVQGSGFDDSLVADDRGLTVADLDRVSVQHPVEVRHLSGHAMYVNSVVLARFGIDAETPDPVGGVIVRDPTGVPTGELGGAGDAPGVRPDPPPRHRRVAYRAARGAAADGAGRGDELPRHVRHRRDAHVLPRVTGRRHAGIAGPFLPRNRRPGAGDPCTRTRGRLVPHRRGEADLRRVHPAAHGRSERALPRPGRLPLRRDGHPDREPCRDGRAGPCCPPAGGDPHQRRRGHRAGPPRHRTGPDRPTPRGPAPPVGTRPDHS